MATPNIATKNLILLLFTLFPFEGAKFIRNRFATWMSQEGSLHLIVNPPADAYGLHDVGAEFFHEVFRDYDLANESHA
jgi:hypothetical protein